MTYIYFFCCFYMTSISILCRFDSIYQVMSCFFYYERFSKKARFVYEPERHERENEESTFHT